VNRPDAVVSTLPQQVKQTREMLCGLLREWDPRAAEWVTEVRHRRPATPSVVVVGETNRGKSSLVNALLEQPGLSPVDADSVTATYLVFQHGERWSGHACLPDRSVPIEWTQLRDWVCADPPDGQRPPHSVRIEAPLELLTRLAVVDTPGVGGLQSWHGERVLEAATEATALLFVMDASAPLGRSELAFLRQVGDRVETVIFALAKIDRQREWRQILAEDRALLAQHAPRFADAQIHPVSAKMLELAGTTRDPQTAETLRQQSGVAELRSALEQLVVGRRAMLGEANTLRALSTVLGEVTVRLEAEKRALTVGAKEAESLQVRREELTAARRSSARGWQLRLRGHIQRTRVELGHEVTRQIREVQGWFRRSIDGAHPRQLAELPQQVDAALQMVSSRVAETLSDRLTSVAETSLDELFSAEELDVIRAQFARGDRPAVMLRRPERRPPNSEDKLLVFMGITGGLGVGRAAALPLAGLGIAAFNPMILPVTIVLGLGAGWWLARARRQVADKQHMKQWLTEAIADARSTLDQLVSEQLIEAEQQLSLAVDDAVAKRIDAIDDELREVDKALHMDAAERADGLRIVQQRLAEVKSGKARVERLLGGIRELRDRVAT
jgi:hypothetical protein